MDAEDRSMSLSVSVELPEAQRDEAIRQLVKRMKETSFFSKVTEAPAADASGALFKIEGEFRDD
jgi:hypothetical protein